LEKAERHEYPLPERREELVQYLARVVEVIASGPPRRQGVGAGHRGRAFGHVRERGERVCHRRAVATSGNAYLRGTPAQ
jgi:hypothetical protein